MIPSGNILIPGNLYCSKQHICLLPPIPCPHILWPYICHGPFFKFVDLFLNFYFLFFFFFFFLKGGGGKDGLRRRGKGGSYLYVAQAFQVKAADPKVEEEMLLHPLHV